MTLRPSFGIFPKLLLTMLVVTLTPLGAIWYLDYRAESESLSRQIEQRLGSQADAIVGYVGLGRDAPAHAAAERGPRGHVIDGRQAAEAPPPRHRHRVQVDLSRLHHRPRRQQR